MYRMEKLPLLLLTVLVWMSCSPCEGQRCSSGSFRLVGPDNIRGEGRPEVCVGGVWGTICDDFWGSTDAGVFCRSIGFSRYNALAIGGARYGEGSGPIHLDDVMCTGSENSILDCSYDSRTADCIHAEDAGVRCARACSTDGELALVGGDDEMEGTVVVCATNGRLGTVCDDRWDFLDAVVVCRQLGFSTFAPVAYTNAHFGQINAPIVMDEVACLGFESQLVNCSNNPGHDCERSEVAGVRCTIDEWLPPAYVNCTNAAIPITIAAAAFLGGIFIVGLGPCIVTWICCAVLASLCCCRKRRPQRVRPVVDQPDYEMEPYSKASRVRDPEDMRESKADLCFRCLCFCLICFFKSMADEDNK